MKVEVKLTERMIHVMKAFTEGKKIEWYDDELDEWKETENPGWDWVTLDYRVKPDVKFRPYEDTEEMLDDFCKRFKVNRTDFGEPFIWVKSKSTGIKFLLTAIGNSHVWTMNTSNSMDDLFDKFTYKNGSPCGKNE